MVLNPKSQTWDPFADAQLYLQPDISLFNMWCTTSSGICAKCRSRAQVCALHTVNDHSFQLCQNVLNATVVNEVLAYDDLRSLGSTESSLSDNSGFYFSYPADIGTSSRYRVISASSFSDNSHRDVSIEYLSAQEDWSAPSTPKRMRKSRSRNDLQKGSLHSSRARSSTGKDKSAKNTEFSSANFGTEEFQELYRQSAISVIYKVSNRMNCVSLKKVVADWLPCCCGTSVDVIRAERCLGDEAVGW